MSSVSDVRSKLVLYLLAATLGMPATAAAQAQEYRTITAEDVLENAADSWSILAEGDETCEDDDPQSDVIVVCRRRIDPEQFMSVIRPQVSPEDDVPRARDPGGMLKPCSSYTVCAKFGSVPPPAVVTDFDALPETPAGSVAARLYGGPTDADIAAEDLAGPEEQEPDLTYPDLSNKARAGLADDVYGP